MKVTSPAVYHRLFKNYALYLEAVVEEAKHRESRTVITDIDEYIELRLLTGAVQPSFDMILLPLSIPEDILEDPRIQKLERLANMLIVSSNVGIRSVMDWRNH